MKRRSCSIYQVTLNKALFFCLVLMIIVEARQQIKISDFSAQVKLQWSFVSEIHHTWFKNIVNSHFSNCQQHKQLNALFNCHTSVNSYKAFWREFIEGVEMIKFSKQIQENNEFKWSLMMIEAAKQWITVNKTSSVIEIEQAYEDINEFPDNLMEFAQFYPEFQDYFDDMKKLINWQRKQKLYLSKKNKDEEMMKNEQTILFKKYFDKKCFQSADFMTECKMPLLRYSYYLKDLFFYYFQQPQKLSTYDQDKGMVKISTLLDYKITKLWRDMREVMEQHLELGQDVSLQQVQKLSPDILQSVMESLAKQGVHKKTSSKQNQPQQNLQL